MKKINWKLLLVVTVALWLRVYRLSEIPYGFHVDEVKAGWNAYSVLKTGLDDWGQKLGWYYNSFGDYRPSAIIYLLIPSIFLLGKTILAVRLPTAILGALSVWPIYLIVNQLIKNKKINWGLVAAGLLAINPWQIMVSRATSEVIAALFFSLWGIYFLLITLEKKRWKEGLWSVAFWIISMLFYHSIRILAPIFVIVTVGFFWKQINRKVVAVAIIISLITVILAIDPAARERMSQVAITGDQTIKLETTNMPMQDGPNNVLMARIFHNKLMVIGRKAMEQYVDYFSPDFLTGEAARPIRYRTSNFGLITYVELALLLLGVMAMAKYEKARWIGLMLLLAPLPAAVTNEDIPNLHRALWMIPMIIILETYGIVLLSESKKYFKYILGGGAVLLTINLLYFCHYYFIHQPFSDAAMYRDGGAVETAKMVMGERNKYERIVVTNRPDSLYPWIAFFGNVDPKSFNQVAKGRNSGTWQWENIEFVEKECPGEWALTQEYKTINKMLVVDGEDCLPVKGMKSTPVKRPDMSVPFHLVERN